MFNYIKSKVVKNLILNKLQKRIKLKLLKYNKKLMELLNITKKDFNEFVELKELSKELKIDIKDFEIAQLDLSNKNIDDKKLEYFLEKFQLFQLLKELNLGNNNITSLDKFEKKSLDKLEILNLNNNKLSEINTLTTDIFKGLKVLNLGGNEIKDINKLQNAKFNNLEELDLSNNNITDIKILEKVNFKELKSLNIS